MKKEIDIITPIPSKRLFLSIIADYDLNKSICELIDNGLDVWIRNGRKRPITISVNLELDGQVIKVQDNAGGLKKAELSYIIGPGQTGTNPSDETIGIFGVGTKRAVVALARDVKIKTRYSKEKTYQIEFDNDWIQDESWDLPVYLINDIDAGNTIIELQSLRLHINEELLQNLQNHLASTYAKFIQDWNIRIVLNGHIVTPTFFENWAYPPNYSPQHFTGTLNSHEGRLIQIDAKAGLTLESSPASGEYGVYVYCNDRLIARALKTFDVGFTKGLAGTPHPKLSLTRVIISLKGDARDMPWNSSKSDINTKHEVFIALQAWLIQAVRDYAALSRIWMGHWPEKVFKYTEGQMVERTKTDFPAVKRSLLPPLPQSRPRFGDRIANLNKRTIKDKPWSKGLYEGIVAVDFIANQRLEQRNRIVLILLDSNLEIAFKEYLVNESGHYYTDAELLAIFKARNKVQVEIQQYVTIKPEVWAKINYYYALRCKLVHERASVSISDEAINDFRDTCEDVLGKLFKLKFE